MDPVSAAGIGIGLTSLTFQLFSGCIKSYQLLLDVADMPQQFEHLQVRLRLEQIRLLTWGDKVGLLQEILEGPSLMLQLHHNLIFDILLQVSQLIVACTKIQGNFKTLGTTSIRGPGLLALDDAASAFGQSTDSLLAKATGLLSRTAELPKRLRWAMIKQDKFKELVEQLISYNHSLVSLLDSASLHQIGDTQRQSELTMLQMSSNVSKLEQLVLAIQIQPQSNQSIIDSAPLGARAHPSRPAHGPLRLENEYASLARLAAFKANHLKHEQDRSSLRSLVIDINDVQIVERTARLDIATFQGHAVWIEWKEFDQQSQNPWYKDVLDNRVQKLATLLHMQDPSSEFRKPDCVGYVREIDDDVLRYGFVSKVPTGAPRTIAPRSLMDLIKHESSPSLSRRIKLARTLASSLMYLHSVNWLHKGFRSENIIFFADTDGKVTYEEPTISGFDYARPDGPGEMTEKAQLIVQHDVYRHPLSIENPRARSRKSWDVYSFGIVLVEIAAWKSIEAITGIDLGAHQAKRKVRTIRDFLLQNTVLDKIGVDCGDRYREVITRCVTGGEHVGSELNADEADPRIGAEMIRVFSTDIVGVLESIQV